MRKIFSLIICCLLFILLSCKNNNSKIQEIVLEKDTIVSQLSDSSFVSDIRSMFFNKYIYLADYKRDQVIILDQNMKFVKTLGEKGNGPSEFNGVSQLFISNDSVFVTNDGKQSIEIFNFNRHIKTVHKPGNLSINCQFKFFDKNNALYISSPSDRNSISVIKINSDSVKHIGQLFKFESKKQTQIRNGRHIFFDDHFLIAVSDNLAIVEKYKLNGELLEVFDYSGLSLINSRVELGKTEKAENSYYAIVSDAYYLNSKLYLLLITNEGNKVYSNNILQLNLNNKKIFAERIIKLGDGWFQSICVTENFILAFDGKNCELVKYLL